MKDNKDDNKPKLEELDIPSVFERMWGELVQALKLGAQHSFKQEVTYIDVLNVMQNIELNHQVEIQADQALREPVELKEE